MYKEIIYGCMFLSFGVLALILAFRTSRPQRKLGRKYVCCGTVTHADPETNTITVTYTLNGTEQTVTQNESLRAQADKLTRSILSSCTVADALPPVGLGVTVMAEPDVPGSPAMIVYTRALPWAPSYQKSGYLDMSPKAVLRRDLLIAICSLIGASACFMKTI